MLEHALPYIIMAVVVLIVAWREGSRLYKNHLIIRKVQKDADDARYDRSIEAVNNLTVVFKKWTAAQNDEDAKKLLAGTLKACEAIAAATVDLKEAVKNFQTLVTGPGRQAGYPEDNVKPPATEDEAELAAVSFEAMLRGIPVAQAEGEARDAAEKKMMISATELGMAE